MTRQNAGDSTCPECNASPRIVDGLLPGAGKHLFTLVSERRSNTPRKTESINFTAEDVTLRQTTYEFTSTASERLVLRGRRLHVLGFVKKKTLPLSSVVDDVGTPLHTLPTDDNGVLAEELLLYLWTAGQGGIMAPSEVRTAIHKVVFATDGKAEDLVHLSKTILRGAPEASPYRSALDALLSDLYDSYLLCVELPDREDGDRCTAQFSYAASVGRPAASDAQRKWTELCVEWAGATARFPRGVLARLASVGTARFLIDVAGLDDAKSTHVQIRVPAGLRASRLRSLPATTASRDQESQDVWANNKGWATGGVAYWRPPREQYRGPAPQARLELDLSLETRGILTAICTTSTILTVALTLLLWVYPSMHPDKEAQDVLVTGILIAPSLVTSFVVANREPGVVSGVAQLPRLLLLANLLTLIGCAVFTITDRAAMPGWIDFAALGFSGFLSAWLLTTWIVSRSKERSSARNIDMPLGNANRREWPIGTFVVPTRHGNQRPMDPYLVLADHDGQKTSARAGFKLRSCYDRGRRVPGPMWRNQRGSN